MRNIKILDCTLRDGGFVNGWRFGYSGINNIVERLNAANVDIIEVGYLRNYAVYDRNSTQFPTVRSINDTLNREKYEQMLVALMDYGSCGMEQICSSKDSVLDGIRLTFKKENLEQALEIGKAIMDKGYKLFLQPVAITDYSGIDVIKLVDKVNVLEPYAICMVDTYGFMNRRDLEKYFYLFDSSLKLSISLGYHSHNNYQLSYANAIDLLERPTDRNLIIDSSVFGMGKGAGNLNTELITSYINTNIEQRYNINSILEILSMYMEKERDHNFWGYNLRYYLAATTNSHHNYVKFLLDKKTLTIEAINDILLSIEDDKKTRYNEGYIIDLYEKYQDKNISDKGSIDKIRKLIGGKKVLILAPGSSIKTEQKKIHKCIDSTDTYVIAVNHYIRGYKQDLLFVSNGIRYSQIENEYWDKIDVPVVATSNISPVSIMPDYVVNYRELLLKGTEVEDNAVLMLFNLLYKIGYKQLRVAGFDGFFNKKEHNYFDENISLEKDLESKNQKIADAIRSLPSDLKIEFITPSYYGKYI